MADEKEEIKDSVVNREVPKSNSALPAAERLVGEHFKANVVDFAGAGLINLVGAYAADSFGTRVKIADRMLNDSVDLSLKMKTDAATMVKQLDSATVSAIQTGQTLNQQNINPVSQGEGESADAQTYPPNRSIDASTALGAGVILGNVANALAQGVNALAALAPVLVTASGGASTPSQTQAKPAA